MGLKQGCNDLIKLYEKYIRHKIFNKMLLIYSIITVVSILLLTNIFIKYYTNNEIKNELNIHSEVMLSIEKVFQQQDSIVNSVANGVNTQPKIIKEINVLTNSSYEEYLSYKLDNYSVTNVKQIDLKYLIDTILGNRSDVLAVIINDKNEEYKNEIVLNHDKWYDLKYEDIDNSHIRKITKPIKDVGTMYTIGYIDVYFDLKMIDDIIKKSNLKGEMIIFNQNEEIVFDSSKIINKSNMSQEEIVGYIKSNEKQNSSYIEHKYPIIQVREDAQTRFQYGSVILEKDLDLLETKTNILLIAIMFITIVLSITFSIIKFYSNKLKNMMKVIDKIKNGDLDARFDIDKEEDELDMIAIRIDNMSESLKYNINKNYISEVKQKQAELNALQSQIKPHFLYNTLEVIRMCALSSKNKEVAQMIYNLASMFRYSTYNNSNLVTLKEEVNHCNMYLSLCSTRYKNMLKYKIDIDKEYLDYLIPKFTLQPILENSINHGIRKDSTENVINISVKKADESISFIIQDNGKGMDKDTLEKIKGELVKNIQKPNSIGLMNINNRLKLKFGEKYGIDIESEDNKGTTVKVNIPILGENVEYV